MVLKSCGFPWKSTGILGGKVQLYRRDRSRFWWCSSSVGGKQRRATTKEDSLARAKEIAEDWYLGLRGKDRAGLLISEKTFRPGGGSVPQGIRGDHRRPPKPPRWVEGHGIRLRLHLLPFFGELGVPPGHAGEGAGIPRSPDNLATSAKSRIQIQPSPYGESARSQHDPR